MKAVFLIRNGEADSAFEIRETPQPTVASKQVLIKVEAFGLNFADVMARRGMYKEAPPLPCVLGYDVAGTVAAVGAGVQHVQVGDRVVGMTRFGGYAEYAVTDAGAVAVIPEGMEPALATALATQYCTAYFAAAEMTNLHPGDKVLVHSGAGGVGTALIQFARFKGCEIYSTAGSQDKLKYLEGMGVQHPINYRSQDFEREVMRLTNGKGVDVIFDAVGGKSVKKGFRALAAGGRIVCFGAADMSNKNLLGKIAAGLGFGIYHPVMFMMPCKSMIGINMLRIADDKPEVIQRCLNKVVELTASGVFAPVLSKQFPVAQIADAHRYLEDRSSMGKVAVTW